jgi:hypothetical protein
MDLTSNSSAHSSYIFPLLKHSDILQCMSELGIEMTKAELAEPVRHKERVRKVFLLLVRSSDACLAYTCLSLCVCFSHSLIAGYLLRSD